MEPDCKYSLGGTKSFARKDNLKRHIKNAHNSADELEPADGARSEHMGAMAANLGVADAELALGMGSRDANMPDETGTMKGPEKDKNMEM
jgi:hypothetical protein